MNKAFMREPEAPDNLHCPQCGAIGVPVSTSTLAAHLRFDEVRLLGNNACFCPSPTCLIAYFDAHEVTVSVDRLTAPVYPKDPSAPLCPCLGITTDDLKRDAKANNPKRIRSLIAHAQSPAAECLVRCPAGRSCIADAQKLYLRHVQR